MGLAGGMQWSLLPPLTFACQEVTVATAVLAKLDTDTGMLSWINAGHPAPLLLRDGKLVRSLHSRPILPLGLVVDGPPAGAVTIGRQQLQTGRPGPFLHRRSDRSPLADRRLFRRAGTDRPAQTEPRRWTPAEETMRRLVHASLDHQQGQLADDAALLLEWRNDNTDAVTP